MMNKHYDVIVAGSGPAGIAAAVSSARMGAKTLLIEWQGCVGGASTTGLMSHFTGRADSALYFEMMQRAADNNDLVNEPTIFIEPETLKLTYYEMLEEAGAQILLYSLVTGVSLENGTVTGVKVLGKSGENIFTCRVLIDCTGDGDAAYLAGAEFTLGRENDNKMQPATLMFKVGGVDTSRAVTPYSFETLVPTEKGELQALAKELLPHPAGHVLLYPSPTPGVVTCNMTNCTDINGTRSEDLTRAEITCRKQMKAIVKFLREYAPGYENCYLLSSASLIGIRETRHFKGKYTLTEQDILEACQFPDWVVRGAHFNFDVHNLTGSGLDETGVQHKFSQPNGYTIPYGCLVPEKIKGLLLAGRNISGTHIAHSSFRVMPICFALGEAAGTAAALCIKNGILPHELTPEKIQEVLIDNL